jgi:HK97 family phage major capsid protein
MTIKLNFDLQRFAGTYNSNISRTDAGALIPETVSQEIIQGAIGQSLVLQLFRKLPNMPTNKTRMPVLSSMPTAYFVNGDTGLKQTSKISWDNKYLQVEEIACIVPIPEAVLDDSAYDIWGEVKPRIMEAFGQVIDGAVLFGVNKPASWPEDIVTGATTAGTVVTEVATGDDLVEDTNQLMAKVEDCAFDVTGFVGDITIKSKYRGLRDKNGGLLFQPSLAAGTPSTLYGQSVLYNKLGYWDITKAKMIAGDFSQAVYAMRQDITYKILDQAVIQDGTGAIVYNLAQQDMVALRCVMRLAWQLPNPINARKQVEASRYPFAIYKPAAV